MSIVRYSVAGSTRLDRRFRRDQSGNVAIAFGMSMVAMFSATGGAIDFARWYNAKSKMQFVMDSASLAGARTLQLTPSGSTTAAIAMAQGYFDRMKPANVDGAVTTFTVAEAGTVLRGEVAFDIPTPFLSVIGIHSFPGRVVAESVISANGNAGTNLELSLVLDVTGSMAGQKIEDLKDAAKELIDIVVWQDQSQYTSKVALAPFSARVNVGNYLTRVSDVQAVRNFDGSPLKGITCVTERIGPEAFTDEKPNSSDRLGAHSGDTGNPAKDNQANYSADGKCIVHGWGGATTELPEIMPLTSDKDALKARVDELPAAGSTAGSLGAAWGWYLLSPKWTGIWTGDSLPAPYSDLTTLGPKGVVKLQKVAVFMTDGEFNTMGAHNYGDGSSEAVTISNNAVSICNNMKAAGIKVYTVGFHLGGNTLATDTLKACASREASDPEGNPSYFIAAESGAELRSAFRQIALQLSTLRIRM